MLMNTVDKTTDFYSLGPDTILDAIEDVGVRCSGRVLQLNSLENRVYEIEIENPSYLSLDQEQKFIVGKFYRPGRWTRQQIEDEHSFLLELDQEEINVVAPLVVQGQSLFTCPQTDIFFCLYPKFSGRNADEFSSQDLQVIGRSLARIHMIGARQNAPSRLRLELGARFSEYCNYLQSEKVIPENFSQRIFNCVNEIEKLASSVTQGLKIQRIHGDAHKGNLIKRYESFFWVDFDDFCMGPAVQDLWLLFPGRDPETRKQLSALIDAYCELTDFNRQSLFLIEPLRTLRVLYFNVWIHKRWSDQYFQRTFENFGTDAYWQEQVSFFAEQENIVRQIFSTGQALLEF